jgi:hypothetical protein
VLARTGSNLPDRPVDWKSAISSRLLAVSEQPPLVVGREDGSREIPTVRISYQATTGEDKTNLEELVRSVISVQ